MARGLVPAPLAERQLRLLRWLVADTEREENIARHRSKLTVPGVHIEHAIYDYWAWSVQCTALGSDTVNRVGVVAYRIKVPLD